MGFAISGLERQSLGQRRGRLGRFELVQINGEETSIAKEQPRLQAQNAVQRTVPAYHTSDDEVPFIPEGPLYLRFHPHVPDREINAVLERHNLTVLRDALGGGVKVAREGLPDPVELSVVLQEEEIVETAVPDFVTYRELLASTPLDDLFVQQWHLRNTGSTFGLKAGADIRAVKAWEALGGFGSDAPIIGVIDDGFDLNHPDLSAKAVAPWDVNSNSSNVQPHFDPVHPEDGDWHGTFCTGLALGRVDGGDIVGIAPNARLMPVRMAADLSPNSVVRCFTHMKENGAWVVSCSWKATPLVYPLPPEVEAAISDCANNGRDGKGSVIVFAAGNLGHDINATDGSTLNGYATHPDVMAISGSTSKDTFWRSSDRGREIALCAPSGGGLGARNITSSDAGGTFTDANGIVHSLGYAPGDYVVNGPSGTSASCPLVSGVVALVLDANPDLRAVEVRDVLRVTARQIGQDSDYENGHSPKFGYGCVDAGAAVNLALEMGENADALIAALETAGLSRTA
ncbi:S8 family serine peptidase [Ruegeria sp. HKCCD8929]|uniref:S8 family serine peptidase n=1 Tax=Ruegeria sp. HKCCD8929 TaxID=2683006 RepID=UPI001489DFFF|nr:S8 family serine peptidase [Ruegeria sp. HKCCD8929]